MHFDAVREMICIETQHFSLIRILLLALGLWPYQQSKFVLFQIILLSGILISYILFQLTAFMTAEYNHNFITKVLSIILFFTIYVIQYNSFLINAHNIRYLLEQLQYTCNELKDENEIAIIKKYGNIAKRYTAVILSFAICSVFIFILLPVWPRFLDIALHINGSKQYYMTYIVTEYFIDPERYFYLILLHTNVVICIGATTIAATGTMLMTYLKHTCGMFRIASYRIEQAMTIEMLKNVGLGDEICKRITYAVDIHCKAMSLSEFMTSSFEGLFFLVIIISVVSLSLNLYGIYRTLSLGNKEEFLLHFIFVTVILLYIFLGNYFGQEIIDHNDHVHATMYNVRWYEAPIHTQKLLLFMMQRGNKAFNLNIGGLFVASLECFATLIKASMSYFTVICSTQ